MDYVLAIETTVETILIVSKPSLFRCLIKLAYVCSLEDVCKVSKLIEIPPTPLKKGGKNSLQSPFLKEI
ncbi:hypothetical protein Cylst_3226 [Cylindrospermum stagnale PCC 7417]|uniref:Uncharacterized protein n=1 Tax=Cylindrospermum stagnale PCC 7417 TaxID=56107 RepID=K9WZZ1_9NOST|nr:hypothetical protein Cylst_3226 [Cylindrospermum stagnale PCC 7417]